MEKFTQNDTVVLISDINNFSDSAEKLIASAKNTYERTKTQLKNKHAAAVNSLDTAYKRNCDLVNNKSKSTMAEAQRIQYEINVMDKDLGRADKYYVKTKQRKEESLSSTTSSKYADSTDYFTTLEQIKAEFTILSKKYTEVLLPGVLNGLNYMFSSKRKQEYEDLIVLRNTVNSFVSEMSDVLPSITNEQLSAMKTDYQKKRQDLINSQNQELQKLEAQYGNSLDRVAGRIYDDMDKLLPDGFVEYLRLLIERYDSTIFKVNAGSAIQDDILNMAFLDYPVDFFVQSPVVGAVLKEKCASILSDDCIRLPLNVLTSDAPVWVVQGDNTNATALQGLVHSIMFGFLSACPVARLTYRIVDPENRGNSISPFFDVKKRLPELFGERIYISREDISAEIRRLNEKIENILQDKLGTQYDNIFDYAKANSDYTAAAELLVLFDFPKGFDERTLGELRNIIRNGSRCGIYTLISYTPTDTEGTVSREFQQNMKTILDMSVTVKQEEQSFTYRGIPFSYYAMPDRSEFAKFFSKYMLIFEGMKNRGIAFSPLIRKLIEFRDSAEFEEHIETLGKMMQDYGEAYAQVPELKAPFPSLVTLGNVFYPADIFSDSPGFDRIVKAFGVERDGGLESTSFVELPLTFDLRNSFNLFLSCPESASRGILRLTHHVIWSFLSFMPVSKVNVCVFDPEQRGNSIIPFLDFRKKLPETFDQKIYTNGEAMHERLIKINNQIDDFIQEKLGNRYRDILDYNLNTPNRAEPVTLLVLYDFPAAMDGRSIDLLQNILRNGNKCGVFTIICHNPGINFSRYENIDERIEQITKYCASMSWKDGHYLLMPYNLQVNIPDELSPSAADRFMEDYLEKSETIKKQGLSFRDILPRELFSQDSSRGLRIPIGVGDGDSIVSINIGEGSSHHGLIAGATGSGKSTLLHTLIMSGMLHYSPDQLHLYLMDFKSGTEFKIYESVKLPHIQLLALDAMQEFGESILENLVAEMEHRGSLFKEAGQTSIRGYTQATGKPLPRILVIMDEFQILFNDSSNRKVAMNCAELTKRIVTEGRAFGIHLLMATQSTKVISDLTLSHGTIEQMRIRIGLKCGEADARYLFSDENDNKALSMMKGPIGTAVMNLDYTEQSNIGFRTAYCDDDTQREYLDLISSTFADYPYTLQTFEGSRTTKLLDFFRSQSIGYTSEHPVRIHMGSLIKVAPPFAVTVDKKKKHNMLICGSNERMSGILVNNYIISASLNSNARVYCIDGDKLVGDEGSSDIYDVLSAAVPGFHTAENRADIINFINEVYQSYQTWKKQSSNESIFVVLKSLQFLDIVKSMLKGEMVDESEFVDDALPPDPEDFNPFASVTSFFEKRSTGDGTTVGEKLLKLIADGSGFGINFVVTSMDYQTVKECMFYGENVLSKFPERIIFSLSAGDADSLIENVSVAGLRDNTVCFTDGVKNTFQLKPYIAPDAEQLRAFLRNL